MYCNECSVPLELECCKNLRGANGTRGELLPIYWRPRQELRILRRAVLRDYSFKE